MKAKDIIRAEIYYSACWEGGHYVVVETVRGIELMSLTEYEQIPNRPKVRLVEVAA